ncbi:MAG: fumarylacetoacetase [Cytophagales bacterium]|nr:MAG: fumarylacetoacetase [Cytophagales bacterium]
MKTWLPISPQSDFSIHNIPFGIFSVGNSSPRVGTRIGDHIIDLSVLAEEGFFDDLPLSDMSVFYENILNFFIEQGKTATNAVRNRIIEIFTQTDYKEKVTALEGQSKGMYESTSVRMHLPLRIGDYTDFYSSIEHATNVGAMFRPDNPLLPNWKHLPVGYHGRASSIVVSGTPIYRPLGQTNPQDAEMPLFGASKRVDFELELAFVVGKNTHLGQRINTQDAEEYIFGFTLFNDWSARDIQRWEYVPLGPFLSKNFGSVISPWIVTLEAITPFRTEAPPHQVEVLPYLKAQANKNFDISLEVILQAKEGEENIITKTNFKHMYWSIHQQLAHHTINGCNINIGDLYASGTISGKENNAYGSLLELTWGGKNPIQLNNGQQRTFIEDYDTIIIRGFASKNNIRVGFGEARSQLLPVIE